MYWNNKEMLINPRWTTSAIILFWIFNKEKPNKAPIGTTDISAWSKRILDWNKKVVKDFKISSVSGYDELEDIFGDNFEYEIIDSTYSNYKCYLILEQMG